MNKRIVVGAGALGSHLLLAGRNLEMGKGRRLSAELIAKIKQERGTSSMRKIAIRHGVSVSKVWALWHES